MKTRINLSGHDFQLLLSLQWTIVVTARIGRLAEDLNIPSRKQTTGTKTIVKTPVIIGIKMGNVTETTAGDTSSSGACY